MDGERRDPPYNADEREMLVAWLDYHRATLAMKCSGLDDEQLRERAVPPSTLSLLGLVRHMAEVERSWFRRVLAGEEAPPLYYSDEDPDGDFDGIATADVGQASVTGEPNVNTLGSWSRRPHPWRPQANFSLVTPVGESPCRSAGSSRI